MAGYLGTKAVILSTTAANVVGNATIGGTLDVTGNVDLNGGTIDGTVIGGATPAAGTFTELTVDGNLISGRTISAAQATTSGTSFTVSGLDPDATEIKVFFNQVSLANVSNSLLVQLGTSGGVITSGYLSISGIPTSIVSSTAGFISYVEVAGHLVSGVMTITKAESGVWLSTHNTRQTTNYPAHGAGILTGAGTPITSVTLTRNDAATFNGGSFYVETRK